MARGSQKKVKTTSTLKKTKTITNEYQSAQLQSPVHYYTYVEDYWEKSPKTDYTYARSASYRSAYSDQGYVSPNMSRRRLRGGNEKTVISPVAALSPTFRDPITGPTYRSYSASQSENRSYTSSSRKRSSVVANPSRSSIVTRSQSQSRSTTPQSQLSQHSHTRNRKTIANHLSFSEQYTTEQNELYAGHDSSEYMERMGEDVTDSAGHTDHSPVAGVSGYHQHQTIVYRDNYAQAELDSQNRAGMDSHGRDRMDSHGRDRMDSHGRDRMDSHGRDRMDIYSRAEMDKQLEYSGQPTSYKEQRINHLYETEHSDSQTSVMTTCQSSESHTSITSRVSSVFTSIVTTIVTIITSSAAVAWLCTKSSYNLLSHGVAKVTGAKSVTGHSLLRRLWTAGRHVYTLLTHAVLLDSSLHRSTNFTRKRSRCCWLPLVLLLPLFLIGICLLFNSGDVSKMVLPITPLHTFFSGSTVTKDSAGVSTADHAALQEKLQQILLTLQTQQGHQTQTDHSLTAQQAALDKLRAEMTVLSAQTQGEQNEVHAHQAQLYTQQGEQIAALQAQLADITVRLQNTVQELETAKLNITLKHEQLDSLQKHMHQLQDSYSAVLLRVQSCCQNNSALAALIHTKVADALSQMMMGGAAGGGGATSSKSFPDWLHDRFMSREDADSKMAAMAAAILAQVKAESAKHNTSGGGAMFVGAAGSVLTEDHVRQMIMKELYVFGADKTGMVDFALESAGGSVISTRCSQTYRRRTAQVSLFGIPLWYQNNSPRTVIQPEVNAGQCWAFQGSQGYLLIQLSGHVKITSFSLEHIPKSLSPTGQIDSAPKDFTVFGLKSEMDNEGKHMGNFTYNDNGPPLQHFPVTMPIEEAYKIIELRVTSNHGNPEYTCIYRFRVHGVLERA